MEDLFISLIFVYGTHETGSLWNKFVNGSIATDSSSEENKNYSSEISDLKKKKMSSVCVKEDFPLVER